MSDHLESLILTEARRQNLLPNADAVRQAAIDLAGASLTPQNLIHLPGKGSISPADYIRSLHDQMPEGFGSIDSESHTSKPSNSLTERYKAEIAASRKQPRITEADLARFSGITRQHLEERYGAAKAK
ncbi:hypothetical protein M2232_009204 [Bradyrhizobium japonicum]|uniref:hypothetical protein n=1 Tax=Bradyrhizobium japonicum TaxID=375 RepID=UPI002226A102|nr:hypothetical protein [Bradyrhizobium japonicum]MCW2225672.1 hypothetical protein [Bradyrhizobium japonicum]MCW2340884.1 hypothetical protein [Bradyrhizobium japonicum]